MSNVKSVITNAMENVRNSEKDDIIETETRTPMTSATKRIAIGTGVALGVVAGIVFTRTFLTSTEKTETPEDV